MKLFAIQAMCKAERIWEVMIMLEYFGCNDILSRPIPQQGADMPLLKQCRTSNYTLILKILHEQGAMAPKKIRVAMREAGSTINKPHGVLFVLKQRGLVVCKNGEYALTAKGREATNGTQTT